MENHFYKVSVTWMGETLGQLEAPQVGQPIAVSAPPEFKGQPGVWSPELLLLASANSCFLSTLLALAEHNHLTLVGYTADIEGQLERIPGQGYRFKELVLRPVVTLEKEGDLELVRRVLEKAERHCIVANALTVPVKVEPRVQLVAPAPVG